MVPDGWKPALVSDICRLRNGRGFTPEEWATAGLPIIRIQNLNGGTHYNYFAGEPEDDWLVNAGQMLFAWAGTKGVSFGPTIWKGETGVLNQHIFKVFPKESVDHEWLFYCLQLVTTRIERKAHGFKATLVHVKKSEIDNQVVALPPLAEQQRIAATLATWDRAIQKLERFAAISALQGKGLRQRLLWGTTRFAHFVKTNRTQLTKYGCIPADWQFPSLAEVSDEVSERNADERDLPVLACSKYAGFVNSLEYFKKKVYSDDTSNYKVVRRGTFGFPSNHIEEGSIGYQNVCDVGLVSPIYCLFRTNGSVCDGYLYSLLKTDHYRQIFSAATNASVDRRGSLRWKDFSAIHVPLPPLEEQQEMSKVLDVADAEIKGLNDHLTALRSERTALMRQLLTGERRVKVGHTEARTACA